MLSIVVVYFASCATADPTLAESLIDASLNGHVEVVEALLAKGADINAKTKIGWTALIGASLKGHVEVVKLLLAKGADINATTEDGRTALMAASSKGHQEVVNLLKAHGAKE